MVEREGDGLGVEDGRPAEAAGHRMETPHGPLFKPRSAWITIPLFLGVFVAGPCLGRVIGMALGGLSENAQTFLYVPFVLVAGFGYSLWMARLQALAFEFLGKGLFKALFVIIVRRRKPENLDELMPTKEKVVKMAVRAQKATSAFWIVSIPIGFLAGAASLLIDSEAGALTRFIAVGGGCVGWGVALWFLARRGLLPFPEE